MVDVTRGDRPVLITGAGGLLARALAATFEGRGPLVAWSRAELDVCDGAAVRTRLAELRPSLILNAAAYNDVDGSEDAPDAALAVNALAVRTLARVAADLDAALVHYSSDFVFDGTATRPYTEDDEPNPRGVYAASKMLGEWFARDAGHWHVLRVESLFGIASFPGVRRLGSLDRIIEALAAGRPARVFHDRIVSPSYVADVAAATAALLDRQAPSGIYHVVNSGHASWLDVAQEIARHVGGVEHIVPTAVAQLQLPVPRPMFAALSNQRLAKTAFVMPSWQDALARYLTRATPATTR
jgi:dTDP-4-dehydrorhamnose reductase